LESKKQRLASIKKIYAEGELEMDSTVRKFRTVQAEGQRQVELDESTTAEDFSVVQISVI